MDGTPNTPDGAPPDAPQPTIVCPTCGTTVPPARFCGACGADLAATGPGTTASGPIGASPAPAKADQAALAPTAPASPALPAQAAAAAPAPTATGVGKTCSWCGAVSAPGATVCSACNATFPTPEGDEALERAARARIEDMQEDIKKLRGAPWWPFRSR